MQIYVVVPGDTVDLIAAKYGVSSSSIIYINQLVYPYALAIGQALLIPEDESEPPTYPAYINGYAYPFIDRSVLDETLPYLTTLSAFSYGFTLEGELIPPELDDQFMIAAAWNAGTLPILTLTPFGPDGRFNNSLISVLVNNEDVKYALFNNLQTTMAEKGFQGVDIDFEYILAEDRYAFASFVEDARDYLSPYGYSVSVALAPKTSDTQPGLLYQGKDYALLGEAADHVLLMTYEWGYTYGPPMAVAPLNKVREVVEYALTRIPANKIDLGIPNYGYDWTLPYIRGSSEAMPLGNVEAMQLAASVGATIMFDEIALSPYFTYEKDGATHEVWFEDVRSLREKFSLVTSYSLRGIGYWQIMRLFRANWYLLNATFQIQKGSS